MTVSSIAGITQEDQPQELSSFLRQGVAYVFWATPVIGLSRRIRWKPHSSADYTEVIPSLLHLYRDVSCLYDPVSDQLVVVWGDGGAVDGSANGLLYSARFNPVTAALVSGPTAIFQGSQARLSYQSTTQNGQMLLYYKTAKNRGVYGRRSDNGGLTWQDAYPLITGQVLGTSAVEVVPYDSSHVTVAQLGSSSRQLQEVGMLQRTRPLTSIVKHPTVANKFFIGEPSKLDNTTLVDNLRGALVLATDNSKLYHLDGVVQGTADSINSVALITTSGSSFTVDASAGPTGNGDDINTYTLTPASVTINVDLPGASCAVAMDVSPSYAYIAEYTDNSAVLGQLVVVDLSTGTTGTVFTGVTGVRAVAVANFLTPKIIFVASTESGVERLRVYQENALTPTLLLNVKLTSRANSITVASDPSNPTGALVYVSCVDRLSIYQYTSSSLPIQMVDSFTLAGGSNFFQAVLASTGNIVVAAANSGVLVLNQSGAVLSQIQLSGKIVNEWVPSKVYSLNDLVSPRTSHQFSKSRYYFRASTAGTSGTAEPAWASTGTMLDNTAQWQPVGLTDGVVTGIAIDGSTHRIYAVGSAGGVLGTDGRVWVITATGLV
jgi:hypothetical protein